MVSEQAGAAQALALLGQPGWGRGCGDIVRVSPSSCPPSPPPHLPKTAPTFSKPAPGTNSTGEALSVSKIRRIWAPCQMFSLSDPCPDASKTLWEIPPPPSAPALITGEECEAQSPVPPASALQKFGVWEGDEFGGHSGKAEGTQGRTAAVLGTGCPCSMLAGRFPKPG